MLFAPTRHPSQTAGMSGRMLPSVRRHIPCRCGPTRAGCCFHHVRSLDNAESPPALVLKTRNRYYAPPPFTWPDDLRHSLRNANRMFSQGRKRGLPEPGAELWPFIQLAQEKHTSGWSDEKRSADQQSGGLCLIAVVSSANGSDLHKRDPGSTQSKGYISCSVNPMKT